MPRGGCILYSSSAVERHGWIIYVNIYFVVFVIVRNLKKKNLC